MKTLSFMFLRFKCSQHNGLFYTIWWKLITSPERKGKLLPFDFDSLQVIVFDPHFILKYKWYVHSSSWKPSWNNNLSKIVHKQSLIVNISIKQLFIWIGILSSNLITHEMYIHFWINWKHILILAE
jgi:hypothetical protein